MKAKKQIDCLGSLALMVSLLASVVIFSSDAHGESILGTYRDIDLSERDLLQEIEELKETKNISVDPDKNIIFTLADHLLLRRVLAHEAEKMNLIPEQDLEARLQRQREIWLSQARRDSLINELTERELEAAAREIYIAHKEDYMTDERVDVAHILIRTRGKDRDVAASEALARELYSKIEAAPERFEDIAKEYSEDAKTAPKGGSLGAMATERLVKQFKKAALALQPGEISEPVETRFGYHIIRLNAHFPSVQMPFENIKGALISEARKQARRTAIETHLTKLKSGNEFRLNKPALQQAYEQYFSGQDKSVEPIQ